MSISILIPTLPARRDNFAMLLHHLQDQIRNNKAEHRVEILFDATPQGKITIGEKRQRLIERARMDYVVFIDDDDWVSHDYIESVLHGIKSNPDCIGIVGWYYVDGTYQKPFRHSIYCGVDNTGNPYFETSEEYKRCPNHLNPIKRSIANKFHFQLSNFGEDTDFAMQMYNAKVLQTEWTIDRVLYFYRYQSNK